MKSQILLLAIWAALITGGFAKLLVYANSPGVAAIASSKWPSDSRLPRPPGFATLVVFAHPRCPCSNATIGELERLVPHTMGKIKNIVVFVKPEVQSGDWVKDGLWKKSNSIVDVVTFVDDGGAEANRFGAKTSGQTFLYSAEGDLVFEGGITPARGHMGDSDGRAAILAYSETGIKAFSKSHAFGCSLEIPQRTTASEVSND